MGVPPTAHSKMQGYFMLQYLAVVEICLTAMSTTPPFFLLLHLMVTVAVIGRTSIGFVPWEHTPTVINRYSEEYYIYNEVVGSKGPNSTGLLIPCSGNNVII